MASVPEVIDAGLACSRTFQSFLAKAKQVRLGGLCDLDCDLSKLETLFDSRGQRHVMSMWTFAGCGILCQGLHQCSQEPESHFTFLCERSAVR